MLQDIGSSGLPPSTLSIQTASSTDHFWPSGGPSDTTVSEALVKGKIDTKRPSLDEVRRAKRFLNEMMDDITSVRKEMNKLNDRLHRTNLFIHHVVNKILS